MSDGTWFLPSPTGEGTLVRGAHAEKDCQGHGCPLHGPSNHWARDMPLVWQPPTDRPRFAGQKLYRRVPGQMLRLCPHGGLHSDPDDLAFQASRGTMARAPVLSLACDCPCACEHEQPF